MPSIMTQTRFVYRSKCTDTSFECVTHLEKSCVIATLFRRGFRKKQKVELKYVGNFVAKTVLGESANQFSLEELCRTQ